MILDPWSFYRRDIEIWTAYSSLFAWKSEMIRRHRNEEGDRIRALQSLFGRPLTAFEIIRPSSVGFIQEVVTIMCKIGLADRDVGI